MASQHSSVDWWKSHPEAYGSIAGVLGLVLICCLYVLWRGPNRRLWWWKKNDPDMPEGADGGNKKPHPSQDSFMYSELGTVRTVSEKPMASPMGSPMATTSATMAPTSPQQQSRPSFSRDAPAVLPVRKSSLFTLKQARKIAATVNQDTPTAPTYRPTSGPIPPNPRQTREFQEPALPPGALPPGAGPPLQVASRPPSQGPRTSGVPSARRSVSSPISAYTDPDFGGVSDRSSFQTYPPPLPSPPLAYAPFMSRTPPPGASPPLGTSATMAPPGAGSYLARSSLPVASRLPARPPSQQRGASPTGSNHSNSLLRPGAISPQSTISGQSSQRLSAPQLPYSHAQTLNALAGNTLSPHPPNGSAASRHANRLSSRSAKSATSIIPSPLAQSMTGDDLGMSDDVYATEFGAAIENKRLEHRSVTYVPQPETDAQAPPLPNDAPSQVSKPGVRARGGAF